MRRVLLTLSVLASAAVLKAQNPYPIIPIDTVQFVSPSKLAATPINDSSDYISPMKNLTYRDTVRFDGIVAMNPKIYGLSTNRKAAYIQRKGGGPWSGVLVMCEPSGTGATLAQLNTETKFYDNFVTGYPVRVTGVIRSFQGDNQVNLIRNNPSWLNEVEQLSLVKDTLVYSTVTVDSLMTGNPTTGWVQKKVEGEKWEGVMVQINNVTVSGRTPSGATRWNWQVVDDNGNALDIRDVSAYFRNDDNEDTVPKVANTFAPPVIGTRIAYIRGMITEYQVTGVNRYGIAPINPSDIGPVTYTSPIVESTARSPIVATSTDSVFVTVKTKQGSARITSAVLNYAVGLGNNTFIPITMTRNLLPNDTMVWYAKVPNQVAGSVVKYWVKVTDINNISKSHPDTLATNSAYLVTNNGLTNIRDLQYSVAANGATIWNGDSLVGINVKGIVTANNLISGTTSLLTIQDGTGPNSAVFIQRSTGDGTNSWNVGDSVEITRATVRESFNVTTLNSILGTVLATGKPLPPFEMNLSIDSFALNRVAYCRPYEAVLMKWDSMVVFSKNADAPSNFGEFSFAKTTSSSNSLRVDDMSDALRNLNNKLQVGMAMNYIQGPMYYSFGNFKLTPRNLADIDLSHLDTLAPVIVLKGNNPDTVKLGTAYADSGAVAIDNIDGDISANIVKTGTVNTNALGTYTLTYKATDAWGNSDSITRTVVVKDSSSVGLNDNELSFAQINLYPVPAKEQLTISANFIKSVPVEMTIVDLLGKTHNSRTFTQKQFTEQIDISNLNSGVYFCVLKSQGGTRTIKFMVSSK